MIALLLTGSTPTFPPLPTHLKDMLKRRVYTPLAPRRPRSATKGTSDANVVAELDADVNAPEEALGAGNTDAAAPGGSLKGVNGTDLPLCRGTIHLFSCMSYNDNNNA